MDYETDPDEYIRRKAAPRKARPPAPVKTELWDKPYPDRAMVTLTAHKYRRLVEGRQAAVNQLVEAVGPAYKEISRLSDLLAELREDNNSLQEQLQDARQTINRLRKTKGA